MTRGVEMPYGVFAPNVIKLEAVELSRQFYGLFLRLSLFCDVIFFILTI